MSTVAASMSPKLKGQQAPNVSREPEDFDVSLAAMLGVYWRAVGSTKAEPMLSFRPIFAFYWKFFVWGVSLYVWPIAKIGDLTLRPFLKRVTNKDMPEWAGWAQATLVSPFTALHRGEMTAVGLAVLRAMVRLLLYYRLRRRLDAISLHLRTRRLERFVENRGLNDEKWSALWFDSRLALLKDSVDAIAARTGFAVIVTLIGIGAPLAAVAKLADLIPEATRHEWAEKAQSILAYTGPIGRIFASAPDDLPDSRALELGMAALQFLCLLIATNWIAVRRIVSMEKIREHEAALFHSFGISMSREMPLDLIAIMLSVLFGLVPIFVQQLRGDRMLDDLVFSGVAAAFYLGLPLYALVRRTCFHLD